MSMPLVTTDPSSTGQLSIEIPAGTLQGLQGDDEQRNTLTRCTVFLEWAGHATGTMSFLWATVAMLGGFCTLLKPADFWCSTAIILIEAFRYVIITRRQHHTFVGSINLIIIFWLS
jgi:hypothetical protein